MKITKKRRKQSNNSSPIVPIDHIKVFGLSDLSSEKSTESSRPQLLMSQEEGFTEDHPEFALFIKAICEDTLASPERLRSSKEVWKGLEELLEGVELDEDD